MEPYTFYNENARNTPNNRETLAQEVFRAVLYSELDFERAPWDAISGDARALVQALLQRDASRRPSAQEALSFRHAPTVARSRVV